MTGPRRLLFWDVDGTLLSTARAGILALEEAARLVCGASPDFQALPTAGLTDAEVAELAIRELGAEVRPETIERLLRAYEQHLPDRLHWRRGGVLPGVIEILELLERRDDVTCLLLTGNTPAGARAKLAHYGLVDYFAAGGDLLAGAFCTEGCDRLTIARRARQLAAEVVAGPPEPSHLYVLGDTPYDVRCGKSIGARTVAIASGQYRLADLQAWQPWLALPSLPAAAEFVKALGL